MTSGDADRRWPRSLYGRGGEPDPRFSLANERTALAWVRTSLAFVAAGVALEALAVPVRTDIRFAIALTLIAAGAMASVQGVVGWWRAEAALRSDRPLPATSATSVALGVVVVVAAGAIAVGSMLPS